MAGDVAYSGGIESARGLEGSTGIEFHGTPEFPTMDDIRQVKDDAEHLKMAVKVQEFLSNQYNSTFNEKMVKTSDKYFESLKKISDDLETKMKKIEKVKGGMTDEERDECLKEILSKREELNETFKDDIKTMMTSMLVHGAGDQSDLIHLISARLTGLEYKRAIAAADASIGSIHGSLAENDVDVKIHEQEAREQELALAKIEFELGRLRQGKITSGFVSTFDAYKRAQEYAEADTTVQSMAKAASLAACKADKQLDARLKMAISDQNPAMLKAHKTINNAKNSANERGKAVVDAVTEAIYRDALELEKRRDGVTPDELTRFEAEMRTSSKLRDRIEKALELEEVKKARRVARKAPDAPQNTQKTRNVLSENFNAANKGAKSQQKITKSAEMPSNKSLKREQALSEAVLAAIRLNDPIEVKARKEVIRKAGIERFILEMTAAHNARQEAIADARSRHEGRTFVDVIRKNNEAYLALGYLSHLHPENRAAIVAFMQERPEPDMKQSIDALTLEDAQKAQEDYQKYTDFNATRDKSLAEEVTAQSFFADVEERLKENPKYRISNAASEKLLKRFTPKEPNLREYSKERIKAAEARSLFFNSSTARRIEHIREHNEIQQLINKPEPANEAERLALAQDVAIKVAHLDAQELAYTNAQTDFMREIAEDPQVDVKAMAIRNSNDTRMHNAIKELQESDIAEEGIVAILNTAKLNEKDEVVIDEKGVGDICEDIGKNSLVAGFALINDESLSAAIRGLQAQDANLVSDAGGAISSYLWLTSRELAAERMKEELKDALKVPSPEKRVEVVTSIVKKFIEENVRDAAELRVRWQAQDDARNIANATSRIGTRYRAVLESKETIMQNAVLPENIKKDLEAARKMVDRYDQTKHGTWQEYLNRLIETGIKSRAEAKLDDKVQAYFESNADIVGDIAAVKAEAEAYQKLRKNIVDRYRSEIKVAETAKDTALREAETRRLAALAATEQKFKTEKETVSTNPDAMSRQRALDKVEETHRKETEEANQAYTKAKTIAEDLYKNSPGYISQATALETLGHLFPHAKIAEKRAEGEKKAKALHELLRQWDVATLKRTELKDKADSLEYFKAVKSKNWAAEKARLNRRIQSQLGETAAATARLKSAKARVKMHEMEEIRLNTMQQNFFYQRRTEDGVLRGNQDKKKALEIKKDKLEGKMTTEEKIDSDIDAAKREIDSRTDIDGAQKQTENARLEEQRQKDKAELEEQKKELEEQKKAIANVEEKIKVSEDNMSRLFEDWADTGKKLNKCLEDRTKAQFDEIIAEADVNQSTALMDQLLREREDAGRNEDAEDARYFRHLKRVEDAQRDKLREQQKMRFFLMIQELQTRMMKWQAISTACGNSVQQLQGMANSFLATQVNAILRT